MHKSRLQAIAAIVALALPAAPGFAAPGRGGAGASVGCEAVSGTVVAKTSFVDCSGFFAGNAIGGSAAQNAVIAQALGELGASYSGAWLSKIEAGGKGYDNGFIDFGQTLYGQTLVGLHFGNIDVGQPLPARGSGNPGNVSVFLKFDFGSNGANGVQLLNTRGFSNAALFATNVTAPVPEPSAWALMIVGFGAAGIAMRRRTRAAAQAAIA